MNDVQYFKINHKSNDNIRVNKGHHTIMSVPIPKKIGPHVRTGTHAQLQSGI